MQASANAPDEISDLVLFAAVVEEKSFTAAAKRAGLAKSSLSARIARLEERAGVRLLHRTTRRLTLTDAGCALYPACARLAQNVSEASRSLVRLTDEVEREVRGNVRVSADTIMGQSIIPVAVAAVCAKHPALTVELVVDDQFVDVIHGGFDVVLRVARKLDAGVVGRKLAEDERYVVGAPSYLQRFGVPRSLGELVQHRCLRYRFANPNVTEWRFFTSSGLRTIDVTGPFVANHDGPLVAAAVAGVGLTVMARSTVQHHIDRGALVRVLADQKLQPVGIWALHPWRRSPPPRVRAVIDAIAVEMKRANAFTA